MLDLNVPNFFTVGIIGVIFWVLFQMAMTYFGIA